MKKTTIKQKALAGSIGIAGLVFTAHAISILTGWYDLAPLYDLLNVDPSTFGWTTISAPGAYLVSKVGYDIFKKDKLQAQLVETFNTDRVVEAEKLVADKLEKSNAIQVENNMLMKQIILIEKAKEDRYNKLEKRLQLDTLKDNSKNISSISTNKLKKDSINQIVEL